MRMPKAAQAASPDPPVQDRSMVVLQYLVAFVCAAVALLLPNLA